MPIDDIAPHLLAATAGIVLALVVGVPLSLRYGRRRFEAGEQQRAETALVETRVLEERIDTRQREIERLEAELGRSRAEHERLAAENRDLSVRVAALDARSTEVGGQLDRVNAEIAKVSAVAAAASIRETELRTRLAETERSFAEKEAHFAKTSDTLKQEFELLAKRIFEEQGQSFTLTNKRELDGLLTPFREQLSEFKQKVEQVHIADTKERASLLTEVRNLQSASERINREAENLTRALKGDKKLQGNWGELVLEKVLDESGLRSGHEYTLQASRRNDEGDAKRPDAIIHLPDDKDIVVDSKVSLGAYERALAADDEAERERAMRQHVADLRMQVKRLSEQDYDRLTGVRSLDFVLLFVPIESAFTLAMEWDPGLFTDAFSRRIVIVSPTTLMMTLRIIHNVWRYERQSQNAQDIASRAGALYDKLRVALEDLERLGNALRNADATYGEAMKKLSAGKGNLVWQVEKLRELGAPVKRAFPREILERAVNDDGVVVEPRLEEEAPESSAPESDID
jgi:DNA recombination protein RmuC